MSEMQRFVGIGGRVFHKDHFRILCQTVGEEILAGRQFSKEFDPPSVRNFKVQKTFDDIESRY
jgi:hypothetical protein